MENLTSIEQIFYDGLVTPLGTWTIIVLIPFLTGIICSFIIEGFNTVTPSKVMGRWITIVVVLGMSALNWFLFPNLVPDIPFKILMGIINVGVALGFYHTFGKRIVEALTKKALGTLGFNPTKMVENKKSGV